MKQWLIYEKLTWWGVKRIWFNFMPCFRLKFSRVGKPKGLGQLALGFINIMWN